MNASELATPTSKGKTMTLIVIGMMVRLMVRMMMI